MSLSTSTVNIPTPQHPVPFKWHLMQQVNLERKGDMITAVGANRSSIPLRCVVDLRGLSKNAGNIHRWIVAYKREPFWFLTCIMS